MNVGLELMRFLAVFSLAGSAAIGDETLQIIGL
jgi:hypothetical protein